MGILRRSVTGRLNVLADRPRLVIAAGVLYLTAEMTAILALIVTYK